MPLLCVALGLALTAGSTVAAEAPVAVRAEHFTVPPSTGPVTHVIVKNLQDKPYQGTVRIELPKGWKANRTEAKVKLGPKETKRVPFAIEHARSEEANRYRVRVSASVPGGTHVREQQLVCASAPHFKPKIDGRTKDWEDAITVTFVHKGKATIVRTYWNRRHFSVLFEIEEDKLVGYRGKPGPKGFDAVQLSLAPREARTGTAPSDKATRYEFLLAASSSFLSRDKCFLLLRAGDSLAEVREPRPLAPLEFKEARLKVKRRKGRTYYECSIPWSAMPRMKPTVGREICFSFLVHDPDGTGLRDWGQAAGLWPSQRNWLAWCSWAGALWGKEAPFDGKTEWGLCTSKY
jgi:hypothetical protein